MHYLELIAFHGIAPAEGASTSRTRWKAARCETHQPGHAVVLADPEGNGPGHLEHNL